MKDKRRSLEQAAERVKDGDQIVMSAGKSWAPMALLRQLVKQGRKDLRLIGVVGGDLNLDFMVGAGTVHSVDTCSVHLSSHARTGPNFERHVKEGRVLALDNT